MKHIIWSTGHKLLLKDIVKAENCYIYNSEGKKYIDLESGVWCTSVGHCNPLVNKAIETQIDKISHTGFFYANPIIEETAKKVLEITGLEEGKCEFLCSGSEAVEYGLRIARTIATKPLALTFSDSYFGAYGEASNKESQKWHIYNWLDCSCKSKSGCRGECSNFEKIPFDQIGIFLFEPGSSSGLVRFPSNMLITKIIERIKENNGIVVVNEITTGVGRTGKWFGYQHYNFQPEIVAIGKGIGNGYPVSVTAISNKVAQALIAKKYLYSQSHQNDPLGAVVAKKVIEIITDGQLLEQCNKLGKILYEGLNSVKNKYPVIKEIRGRGLIFAIEFYENAELIQKELLNKGFIIVKRSGVEVLRMDPALTIEEQDLKNFLETFDTILKNNQK